MMRLVSRLSFLVNIPALLIVLVGTFVVGLIIIPLAAFHRPIGFYIQRQWACFSCWILGIRIRYVGLENLPRSGAILAANHSSVFDMYILATLPVDIVWISKKGIKYVPFVGWALWIMGTYFVSRDRSGSDLNVMKEVETGLRHGATVIIFPEGTRTRDGELLPLRKGAFRLAMNTGAPLSPIGIAGAYEIAPPYRLPTHWGHSVTVRIAPPVYLTPESPITEAMTSFRQTLLELRTPSH